MFAEGKPTCPQNHGCTSYNVHTLMCTRFMYNGTRIAVEFFLIMCVTIEMVIQTTKLRWKLCEYWVVNGCPSAYLALEHIKRGIIITYQKWRNCSLLYSIQLLNALVLKVTKFSWNERRKFRSWFFEICFEQNKWKSLSEIHFQDYCE